MSDQVAIESGHEPWLPTTDAKTGPVLLFHDAPLCGLIEQHGAKFLYWCIEGHAQTWNVWAYTHITEREAQALEASTDLDAAVSALVDTHLLTIAIAHEDHGLIGHVDAVRQSALDPATRFLVSNIEDPQLADSAAHALRLAS